MTPQSQFFGAITLEDAEAGPGPLYKRHFGAVEALVPGLCVLAAQPLEREDAYILLAGFVAEGALKTLLAHAQESHGQPASINRSHDLEQLWQAAAAQFTPPLPTPVWIQALNKFHNRPFFVRYQAPGGFYSLPPRAPLHQDLLALLAMVKAKVA